MIRASGASERAIGQIVTGERAKVVLCENNLVEVTG